jgi:hypothetical protein
MKDPFTKRNLTFCLILWVCLFFAFFPLFNDKRASLGAAEIVVKANIPPRLHMKTLYQRPEITISQPDIQKGYLELPSASLFEVECNNPNGYLLAFEGSLGPCREVHIQGLNNPVQLESGNAFVLQPQIRLKKETIELSYRCILSKNISPGMYSWPFSISVRPVEYMDSLRKKR